VAGSQSRGRNSDSGSTSSIFPPQIQNPSGSGIGLKEGIPLEAGPAEPSTSMECLPGNVIEKVNSPAKKSAKEGRQQNLIELDEASLPPSEDANISLPLNKH
jgi:hypothetical protein